MSQSTPACNKTLDLKSLDLLFGAGNLSQSGTTKAVCCQYTQKFVLTGLVGWCMRQLISNVIQVLTITICLGSIYDPNFKSLGAPAYIPEHPPKCKKHCYCYVWLLSLCFAPSPLSFSVSCQSAFGGSSTVGQPHVQSGSCPLAN